MYMCIMLQVNIFVNFSEIFKNYNFYLKALLKL